MKAVTSTQSVTFSVEIVAELTGDTVEDDYGVPNSPTFYTTDVKGFASVRVEVNGVNLSLKGLPKEWVDVLYEAAIEEIKDDDWVWEEPYHPDL